MAHTILAEDGGPMDTYFDRHPEKAFKPSMKVHTAPVKCDDSGCKIDMTPRGKEESIRVNGNKS